MFKNMKNPFSMTILCIDDDPEDREVFCDALYTIDTSYKCITATNGATGLNVLHSIKPDVIFLDMNMPVLDGKQTLEEIRKDDGLKEVKVCIFSTSITPFETETYKKMGANYCVKKPNSFKDLCSTLKVVIATSYSTVR
jgi:CheY-like chemotaxis protein